MSWEPYQVGQLVDAIKDIAHDDFKNTNGIIYNLATLFPDSKEWLEQSVVFTVKSGKIYVAKCKDVSSSSGWIVLKDQVILNPDNIVSVEPKKEGFIMGGCNMSQLKA